MTSSLWTPRTFSVFLAMVRDAGRHGLIGHFPGQQHEAVVARHVEVDAIAEFAVGLSGES